MFIEEVFKDLEQLYFNLKADREVNAVDKNFIKNSEVLQFMVEKEYLSKTKDGKIFVSDKGRHFLLNFFS